MTIHFPEGRVVVAAAEPLFEPTGEVRSKGGRKERFSFAALPESRYQIAIERRGSCLSKMVSFIVKIEERNQIISFNLESLRKRFNVPIETLMEAEQGERLDQIVEKVRINQWLGRVQERGVATRFSKNQEAALPSSVTILPNGFVAIDLVSDFFRKGASAKVKQSRTMDGTILARRICKRIKGVGRLFNHLNLFKNKPGILQTIETVIYVNKEGKKKGVSYHPFYESNLYLWEIGRQFRSDWEKMQMAYDLLRGLAEIAKRGVHGDIKRENVLLRRASLYCEAVIADFDFFNQGSVSANHEWAPPEYLLKQADEIPYGPQSDIWPMGAILLFIFQSRCPPPPFPSINDRYGRLVPKAAPLFTQENIDRYIDKEKFRPEIAHLLKGMLKVEPEERWSAGKALASFMEIVEKDGLLADLNRRDRYLRPPA